MPMWKLRAALHGFLKEETRASGCVECRACEDKCPQGIPISEWMPKVHSVLGEGKDYEAV